MATGIEKEWIIYHPDGVVICNHTDEDNLNDYAYFIKDYLGNVRAARSAAFAMLRNCRELFLKKDHFAFLIHYQL